MYLSGYLQDSWSVCLGLKEREVEERDAGMKERKKEEKNRKMS